MKLWSHHRFRRVRERVRRLTEIIPVTFLGVVLGVLCVAAWEFWAEGSLDFVIRAVVVTTGIVVLICTAITIIGVAVVISTVRHPDKPVSGEWETGEIRPTGFAVRQLVWWPFIQVDVRWSNPDKVDVEIRKKDGYWTEFVRFRERGRHTQVERAVTIRDIFGFSAVTLRHRQPASVRVAPHKSRVSISPDLRSSDGDGVSNPLGEPVGDFVEMRRYAPGDPLRLVLWKAYARSRRLLVRAPERAVAPMPSTAAYFVCGAEDEDSACVARTVVESGLLGDDLVFGADGAPYLAHTPRTAVDAIIDSVHHRERGGVDFAQFVARIDRSKLSQCVLFVPGRPGPWIKNLEAAVLRLPRLPLILMTVDGPAVITRSRKQRMFFQAPKEEERMRQLPKLYDLVKGLGSSIQVIHRGEGRALTTPEIDGLRAP